MHYFCYGCLLYTSKIEVIYNWVDETAIIPIPRNENPLFAEFGLDQNKFYVDHYIAGDYHRNIGVRQYDRNQWRKICGTTEKDKQGVL